MYIDATEEFIFNYGNLHPDLYGWRYYRLEYGGCNEDCKFEGRILLPPEVDIEKVLEYINSLIPKEENESLDMPKMW
jgi:hypothetical protein